VSVDGLGSGASQWLKLGVSVCSIRLIVAYNAESWIMYR
jgi:hypothetical protein